MTHSALNHTDTQAPDCLEVLHPAFGRFLGETRPEGALPVLLSPARLFFPLTSRAGTKDTPSHFSASAVISGASIQGQ